MLGRRGGLILVQAASLMSSVFLMRFQSGTLKLERGAPTERCQQHENRHSAVWCEEIEGRGIMLFVKLFRRKNRPLEAFCGEHVLAIWEMRGAVWFTWDNVS